MEYSSDIVKESLNPEIRIKALAEESMVQIDPTIKAIRYVRSGKELINTAECYYKDGSLGNAYLLYMRYLGLSMEQLREHPGYKELPEEVKKDVKSNCKKVLTMAETIKKELRVKYQKEYDDYWKNKRLIEQEQQRSVSNDVKVSTNVDASLHSSFIQQQYDHNRTIQPPTAPEVSSYGQNQSIQNPLAAIKSLHFDFPKDEQEHNIINSVNGTVTTSIHKSNQATIEAPRFDRASKPTRLLSPIGTDSLRTVVIPGNTVETFVNLASSNTSKNIETCGVLCGKVICDQLVITHLVLPKQSGTSDSCTTLNEEEIYGIIDKHSLIQMGWIHTHPSQTSFLSSVDLHTHLSYQLMMPESIAIVCAPSKQEYDVFTLTSIGMEALQKCPDSGFHPHPPLQDPYFVGASHSTFDTTKRIVVEDLRRF